MGDGEFVLGYDFEGALALTPSLEWRLDCLRLDLASPSNIDTNKGREDWPKYLSSPFPYFLGWRGCRHPLPCSGFTSTTIALSV